MKKYLIFLLFLPFFNFSAQDLGLSESNSRIGGYGELHYNLVKPDGADAKKTLDFHRFVMFFSHSFGEKWSFKAEVELEHNFVGEDKGELELEQAIIDYHHSDAFGFQAGVLLVSAGIINEIHEPPTFLGVERPDYSKNIIPTTWFGNGAAIYGNIDGFDYKFSVLEGLNGDKFKMSSGIRSGRQEGFKSNAESFLYNGRINYTKIDGLTFGVSATFNNAFKADTTGINISLIEGHLQYMKDNLYITAEAGNISYSEQDWKSSFGFYTDLGYDIADLLNIEGKLIPFVRYSDINTVNSHSAGGNIEKKYHNTKVMFGINYSPIDEIVFKTDIATVKNELSDKSTLLFNIGCGYMF